jgi:hypothetical protein
MRFSNLFFSKGAISPFVPTTEHRVSTFVHARNAKVTGKLKTDEKEQLIKSTGKKRNEPVMKHITWRRASAPWG